MKSLFLTSLCLPLALCGQNTTYPSKAEITDIFSSIASSSPSYKTFFSHVSPNVNWTIEGTHPAAGVYTNRTVLEATFARISATASKQHPLSLSLHNVIGGGDEEWSVQELQVYGVCKSGMFRNNDFTPMMDFANAICLGLIFDNRYAWATRWGEDDKIVEARAYLDSALVSEALQQNEIGTRFTYSDPRDTLLPFVGLPQKVLDGTTGLSQE